VDTLVVIVSTVPVVSVPPSIGDVKMAPSTPPLDDPGSYIGEILRVHVLLRLSVRVSTVYADPSASELFSAITQTASEPAAKFDPGENVPVVAFVET
jgi:hypothetical protein